ncbi:MAG: hypothetical protein NTV68_08065 [Methanomicrobiales archaeon]|nr:hypothetical protein [Methanomicrobiales archaeon]
MTPFSGGEPVESYGKVTIITRQGKKQMMFFGAFCPLCPAVRTPDGSNISSPMKAGEYRRQQFICYYYQN